MEGVGPLIALAAWLIIMLFFKIGRVAMAIVLENFYPHYLEGVYRTYSDRPRRCAAAGLVNLVAGIILVAVFLNVPFLVLFGLALIGFLFAMIIVGYTAVYRDLGQRLLYRQSDENRLRVILWGGIAAEAAFFTPILGQIFHVWVLFRGLGAVVITLLARNRDTSASAAEPPPANDSSPSE